MKTSTRAIRATLAAVLVLAGPGWAFEISVNSTAVLFDDFESPDVVGAAPTANVGAWTLAGGSVQNGPPGASQGGQYCALPTSTTLRHTLASPVSAPGSVVKVDTMVYLPAAAAGQDHWYQMVWFNTSGIIIGASNSPIHTSIAGGQLQYYDGTDYRAGASLQFGVWQHWTVEYAVGSGQFTVTIDGVPTVMNCNAVSADKGIGTISFFTNAAATSAWLFDASVSQGSNNQCADAYAVGGGTFLGSTTGATPDGTSSCGNSNSSPDVWYKHTAGLTGQLKLDTCGSAFDTVLSVHAAGCPGTSATQLAGACNDDCGQSPCGGPASCLEVPMVVGTEYLIRVAGKNGASGDFTLHMAEVADCPDLPFPQHFDTTSLGSPACWVTGSRWFAPNPGAAVGVTDADSQSPPHSLKATGSGVTMMTWRDYKGLSSNGTDPISVSFDFKVNQFPGNVAIAPFAFNGSLWGTAGTAAADPFGWPVNTNFQPDGALTYIDELAGTVTMFAKNWADLEGEWIRWTGTLYPATRKADVAVEVLTGPAAGTSGGVVGRDFQVAQDYYAQAMDELRGSVFFTPAESSFGDGDEFLIDNYDVRAGTATLGTPINDTCANALTVTSGKVYGRTLGATSDGSATCGNTAGSPDVWYRYTANCTGQLLVKSCGSGFGYAVSVHQNTCPGTAATELAAGCNAGCGTSLCDSFQPCLSVPVVEATTYLIRVAGVAGASGFFGLDLACASIAANDNCSAATAVSEGTFTGATLLATNDGDATCGSSGTSPDVWFLYTASCTGQASINTFGSSFDTVLSVHSGACPGGLQNELICNDDSGGGQSSLTLQVTQGSVYLIRLAGKNAAVGEYTLNISCSDPCPNPGLPQNFDLDAVGSPACWTAGPRFFGVVEGLAAVTDADSVSSPNSLAVSGTGLQPHAWRDYSGKSSDGVRPVTVSLDMKVVEFAADVTITPFIFNHALFGSAGTPHPDGLGWPVDTKYSPSGAFVYYEDGNPITILNTTRADVNGQWFRYTATINPATRLTDVTVAILTGPAAGQTGTVTGKQVQYLAGSDYYGPAMDELRGSGFFTQTELASGQQILVDNYNVTIGGACPRPFADTDGDTDVDQVDFAAFQRCLATVEIGILEGCECFDRDSGGQGDGDIDAADFDKFVSCASGPAMPAVASCGD